MVLTERDIQKALFRKFKPGPYLFHLCNCYVFRHDWESDFYFQTKNGVHVEVEIKISRSDFKKDLQKIHKHEILNRVLNKGAQLIPFPTSRHTTRQPMNSDPGYWDQVELAGQTNPLSWFVLGKHPVPNKFYYAAPVGLLRPSEIPDYAGFVEVHKETYIDRNDGNKAKTHIYSLIVKSAPVIHRKKHDLNRKLMVKFYTQYLKTMFDLNDEDRSVIDSITEEVEITDGTIQP